VSNNNSPATRTDEQAAEDQRAWQKIAVYNLCLKLRHSLNNCADDLNQVRTALLRGTLDNLHMQLELASTSYQEIRSTFEEIRTKLHNLYPDRL
jgi:hypothetical protein